MLDFNLDAVTGSTDPLENTCSHINTYFLCTLMLRRIHKDGRQPHTVRLTIRQFSSTDKWFNRESRQCPIPPHLIQKFGKGQLRILVSTLCKILLFDGMVKFPTLSIWKLFHDL